MILVTGGAGYIGSHCVLALLENGYDVIIFDNLDLGHRETVDTLKSLKTEGVLYDFVEGDLKDVTAINSLLGEYDVDAVIHFAAYSQVSESMNNPSKYYINNVCGTINLLESMIVHNIKKIVFSSSAAVYGEPMYIPIDEKHPVNPINPYGASKLMIERIMDDFDRSYNLRSTRLRYFNVVGADYMARIGEWHNPETHLIPNILKSTFDNDKVFQMFGDDYPTRDGTCVRDYVNVEDLADAHILALKYLLDGGKTDYFNLGSNTGCTVKEIFFECERISGKKIPVSIMPRRSGDPISLLADNTKAQNILKWKPKRNISDSIRTAYQWEKNLAIQNHSDDE